MALFWWFFYNRFIKAFYLRTVKRFIKLVFFLNFMSGKNAGLTEVSRIKRHYQYHQDWNFGQGYVLFAKQKRNF